MAGEDWLILRPQGTTFAVIKPDIVLMRFDLGPQTEFVEHPIAIQMTPTEARQIAQILIAKAQEAESA
jgi:hypothetical protein